MLRRLIVLTVSSMLAALALAGPADAREISSVLTPGDPTTATVPIAGGSVSYTFAANTGQHVTFDVSASNWGGGIGYLTLHNPTGGQYGYVTLGSAATYGDFTLNATGIWSVVVAPYAGATGSATFTLAFDVVGGALTPGIAVTQPIGYRGQNANYTFSGTTGQHITLDVSASDWGGGIAYLTLYNPSGGQYGYATLGSAATFGDFTLNATGTWTVRLDPYVAATGSATFRLLTP